MVLSSAVQARAEQKAVPISKRSILVGNSLLNLIIRNVHI